MSSVLTSAVHDIPSITNLTGNSYLISGNYDYYHYLCDSFDDRGWGCGYRTLQTICSWLNYNGNDVKVPTVREIQEILVQLEDKPNSFLNSRQWIGSFEVCLVIDKLYNIPSKIIHVNKGEELINSVPLLVKHFDEVGSPVMMGGDLDCSSKGILGINVTEDDTSLLIVDPHYVGKVPTKEFLFNKGWVKWQRLTDFVNSSFYNLCLPQVKAKCKTEESKVTD